jgi:hypothetical protein
MIYYHSFWPDFYEETPHRWNSFFESILPKDKTIRIHSCFYSNPYIGDGDNDDLHISYSGEPFNLVPLSDYDINLIMQPTDLSMRIVCLPLFVIESHVSNFWPLYTAPRADPSKKQHFCAFVITNPNATPRNNFFTKLSKYKFVHSCGRAMNNCGIVAPHENYFEFLSQFKFMICFENSPTPENLTEKLHNAYLGGTIPIHWGGDRACEWLNPAAFLQLNTSGTDEEVDALIQRIIELDTNDTSYNEVYNQPLLRDNEIPEEFTIEYLRSKINEVL